MPSILLVSPTLGGGGLFWSFEAHPGRLVKLQLLLLPDAATGPGLLCLILETPSRLETPPTCLLQGTELSRTIQSAPALTTALSQRGRLIWALIEIACDFLQPLAETRLRRALNRT